MERVNDILIESFDFVAVFQYKLLYLCSVTVTVFFRVRWHRND